MLDITQNELRSVLSYNEATGDFTWIEQTSSRSLVGDIAGCESGNGYVQITVFNKKYTAHRLAFLYMTGNIPNQIDHVNGAGCDNSWPNLRECNSSQNQLNRGPSKRNTSGYKGVSWSSQSNKWKSSIQVNGESMHIGFFEDPREAAKAYNNKALKLCPYFVKLNIIED